MGIYHIMNLEDNKGHISIDGEYIILFISDDIDKSRKWPMSVVADANDKLLHDILKLANRGKLYLTENGLKVFDKIIENWRN